jgi:hypothetical protein
MRYSTTIGTVRRRAASPRGASKTSERTIVDVSGGGGIYLVSLVTPTCEHGPDAVYLRHDVAQFIFGAVVTSGSYSL